MCIRDRQLEISSAVTFTGKLEKHEVATILNRSNVLLHCSKLETFGLVVIEALCCGLFVVSTPSKGVDMMKNCDGLFISQDHSIESIKKEMESVIDLISKTKSTELRSTISSKAKEAYDVKGYLKKYEKVIGPFYKEKGLSLIHI